MSDSINTHTQVYLVSDLLPLHLQHLLLLIGVINYRLSSNQQFALHGLRNKDKRLIIHAHFLLCLMYSIITRRTLFTGTLYFSMIFSRAS